METSLSGLANSRNYQVAVRAVNAAGVVGRLSASTQMSTTVATAASEPLSLSVATTGGGLYCNWQRPLDLGGRVLRFYRVWVRDADDSNGPADAVVAAETTQLTATIGGLQVSKCRRVPFRFSLWLTVHLL